MHYFAGQKMHHFTALLQRKALMLQEDNDKQHSLCMMNSILKTVVMSQ